MRIHVGVQTFYLCDMILFCVYFHLYHNMNLIGGGSRFTPCATVCMLILFCVCFDLYHVVNFNSWGMLLQTERDIYARNGARHHVRM